MGILVVMCAVVLITLASACHPECTSACSSTVCKAECEILASPINCSIVCANASHLASCAPADCAFGPLQRDQCEQDSCPSLEVLCKPPSCNVPGSICEIQCNALRSGWQCRAPPCWERSCPVECEEPACVADPSTMSIKVSGSAHCSPASWLMTACVISLCLAMLYAPDGVATT